MLPGLECFVPTCAWGNERVTLFVVPCAIERDHGMTCACMHSTLWHTISCTHPCMAAACPAQQCASACRSPGACIPWHMLPPNELHEHTIRSMHTSPVILGYSVACDEITWLVDKRARD